MSTMRALAVCAAFMAVAPVATAIDFNSMLDTAQRIAKAAKPEEIDEAAQEKLLGEEAAREILSRAPLAPLPGLQRYVKIGRAHV